MIIREASRQDLFSIAKVQVDSNRTTYRGIMPEDYLNNLSYESKAKSWEERLFIEDNKEFMYVAEVDNANIIGFASAGLVKTNELFDREINSIYILKEFQRQGIGRLLIKAIITEFIKNNVRSMIIWTLQDNPSRYFYQYLGGKIVDKRKIQRGGKELIQIAYGWDDIKCMPIDYIM
jgi:ribosomal protein S18 acetylase RimI-like enzyme